jgi:hypothetical protein
MAVAPLNRRKITITHLYPIEMNIYGDTGNVMVLNWRLRRYGYSPKVVSVKIGQNIPGDTDILVAGGGQDSGQTTIQADLRSKAKELKAMTEDGMVILSICGMYQLFGHYFETSDGQRIQGVGIFDAHTVADHDRLIGNIVINTPFGRMVGFENHSGRTILHDGQLPLGRVVKGSGNDVKSGKEGAVHLNAFGSYLHGPILPKNPVFADELITRAVTRRYGSANLSPAIDDKTALQAAVHAAKRP